MESKFLKIILFFSLFILNQSISINNLNCFRLGQNNFLKGEDFDTTLECIFSSTNNNTKHNLKVEYINTTSANLNINLNISLSSKEEYKISCSNNKLVWSNSINVCQDFPFMLFKNNAHLL